MYTLKYFTKELSRAILLIYRAGRRTFFVSLILLFLQAILPILSLYFIKAILDTIMSKSPSFDPVLTYLVLLGITQLLQSLAAQYAGYLQMTSQYELSDYLAEKILQKAADVDYAYYENPAYHDTLHLAQQQAFYKSIQLNVQFNALILNSLSLLFLVGYLFTIQMLFALFFILLCVPLAIVKWYSGVALMRVEGKLAPGEREAGYLQKILTDVTYAKEARLFSYAPSFIEKYRRMKKEIHTEKDRIHRRYMLFSLLAEMIEVLAMVVLFGMLAWQTMDKVITAGVFVIYIQGFQRLQLTSKNFLQALVQLFQQRYFLKDLFLFLDIPAVHATEQKMVFPEKAATGLTVDQLCFSYPGTEKEVLHHVSVHCEPGKIIAIVGENGSGKSTLVKLLSGLYPVQQGSIHVNGLPIDAIAKESYRANTFFLFQDFQEYHFTIQENIHLASLHTRSNDQDIKTAARLSGAHDFIVALSKGYETRMGSIFSGSQQLSGGQWQKLALSRMFYKKEARLVVLDEPTSALDALAEADIFKNIQAYTDNRMIVLITHRLYNLKMADRIYVMKDGNIIEEGSFNELIKDKKHFYSMYEKQRW